VIASTTIPTAWDTVRSYLLSFQHVPDRRGARYRCDQVGIAPDATGAAVLVTQFEHFSQAWAPNSIMVPSIDDVGRIEAFLHFCVDDVSRCAKPVIRQLSELSLNFDGGNPSVRPPFFGLHRRRHTHRRTQHHRRRKAAPPSPGSPPTATAHPSPKPTPPPSPPPTATTTPTAAPVAPHPPGPATTPTSTHPPRHSPASPTSAHDSTTPPSESSSPLTRCSIHPTRNRPTGTPMHATTRHLSRTRQVCVPWVQTAGTPLLAAGAESPALKPTAPIHNGPTVPRVCPRRPTLTSLHRTSTPRR
jgi:hypothetical protein